jgi:branched-chain amino acid aminotransferase
VAFRMVIDPVPEWNSVLEGLLRENKLTMGPAAIKIVVTRGIEATPGMPNPESPTVCVMARRYDPPTPLAYKKGLRLNILEDGFAPPLAQFKTLNYLYYLVARQTALDAGGDEAILLDNAGKVTETSSGSLLLRTDNRWWTPESKYQLPGTTLRKVAGIFAREGVSIEKRPSRSEDLFTAKTVWVLNSLVGIMPVSEIDGHPVGNPNADEADKIRRELFRAG